MSISNQYTEHGIKAEDAARKAFCEKNPSFKVFQTGLLVPPLNRWISYSPDGVIFSDGSPAALLEIKAPFTGKELTILEALKEGSFKSCLVTKKTKGKNGEKGKKEGNDELVFPLQLKMKHKYYGQVQLGMFMLNVPKAYFVICILRLTILETIEIKYNESFVTEMLKVVKKSYFEFMLHMSHCDKSLCKKSFSQIQEET